MKKHILKSLLATAALIAHLPAPAEDIDLFINTPPTSDTDLPNVLFVIDNTANWNNAFTNEMAALANTLHNLPVKSDGSAKFKVGIMFATETGGSNNNISGGYVRAAVRPMTSDNKLKYEALVNNFDKLNDKGNGGASGVTMAEAYYYFKGAAPYSGNNKAKTDYAGNTCVGCNLTTTQIAVNNAVYALTGNALSSKGATTYNSPVTSGSCGKNYIIYISNGANQENSSADTLANNMLQAQGGDITQIPLSPTGSQPNPSDEWARFMRKSGMAVTTFAIDVDPGSTGQGPGWTQLLKSMSEGVGGGSYYAVTSTSGSASIQAAINDALSKIQSVNSVFAAVSLPASANVRGAYLNQIFIGMFRPDENVKPRWLGNLKQYKLGSGDNLVDADGESAINGQTGFITECARTYWTPSKTNTDSYWVNNPKGECIPPGSDTSLYAKSNTPDGNIVEKGAQAYVLRNGTASARRVNTCSTSFASCTSLIDFNTTNVSVASVGAADSTERDLLVNWARGQNVDGELSKTTTEMRPSSHGDVIHSNPMALSFGSDVVVFYGGNDGMLRAINGNQTGNIGTVAPGGELWSFMPPEFYGKIKRLRDNSPLLSIGGINGSPKPYGIDGPITAYKDASRTWIYATMRRGGRAIYAFAIDPSNLTTPSLKWKKGCPNMSDDTGCTTGFEGIGQTWSIAQPVKVPGYSSGTAPVLLMGGGYDPCEDGDPNTCTSANKGNKIFVMDADTGALLKTLSTDRGVVGDVKVVPGTNGQAKYAYAADLGGNLYRITIDTAAPADWTITKIASLGCDTPAACANNRKFMFASSVVLDQDGSYSIYIGSGDREKPLTSYTNAAAVVNYFFKVKDNPASATWLSSEADHCAGLSIICKNSLQSAGSASSGCSGLQGSSSSKGWFLGLRQMEQVVTPAATRFGVTTFDTHIPAVAQPGVCGSNLGTTHVYNIDIATAMPAEGTTCNNVMAGGGLPPPPEKKTICMNNDCSEKHDVCIGCTTKSSIEGTPDELHGFSPEKTPKHRIYWYLQQ